ncbi:transposase, partial [Elizabethkingia argenteiflava]
GTMKKSKFSERQIIKIMSEHEAVQNVSDIWREHGITQGTYYSCKSKYSGMKVSQLKQLGEIEKEL